MCLSVLHSEEFQYNIKGNNPNAAVIKIHSHTTPETLQHLTFLTQSASQNHSWNEMS